MAGFAPVIYTAIVDFSSAFGWTNSLLDGFSGSAVGGRSRDLRIQYGLAGGFPSDRRPCCRHFGSGMVWHVAGPDHEARKSCARSDDLTRVDRSIAFLVAGVGCGYSFHFVGIHATERRRAMDFIAAVLDGRDRIVSLAR